MTDSDSANPNEYDDEAYTTASLKLVSAIVSLWEAGARPSDIENEIANALSEAEAPAGLLLTVQTG